MQHLQNQLLLSFYISLLLFELFSFLRFILYDGDINTLLNSFLVDKDMSYSDSDIYKGIYSSISPITKELEIQVLKYFNYLCKDALKKYPTSWEEDKMLLKSKKNISYNMKNCLILIMSEKKVLLYFINFCEYCLKLLKMNEIEIKFMKLKLSKYFLFKISKTKKNFHKELFLLETLIAKGIIIK